MSQFELSPINLPGTSGFASNTGGAGDVPGNVPGAACGGGTCGEAACGASL